MKSRWLVLLALFWPGVALAQPGPVPPPAVQTTTGGQNSGSVAVSQTPANSSHAAGTSVGGLFTLPVARNAGGSGVVTQVGVRSLGGYTSGYVLRVWQKNPAATTCTDNVAFASNASDNLQQLSAPVTLYPQPVPFGDGASYRFVDIEWSYKNADTAPSTNLYACLIALSTDTADEGQAVTVFVSASQN